MKISEAKAIPLSLIVEYLGGRYSHTDRSGSKWYFSPFRPEEKTASFKANDQTGKWHDFGLSGTLGHRAQGSGGDGIDLWCDYNFKDRRSGVKDALQAFSQFSPALTPNYKRYSQTSHTLKVQPPRYKILKIAERINFVGLKEELNRRRISFALANLYLKQGYIQDTVAGKKYYGFLFENDKGGYEVSIPNPQQQKCFKTCIGPKASTRILVGDSINKADVFEGFWDMLTWLE